MALVQPLVIAGATWRLTRDSNCCDSAVSLSPSLTWRDMQYVVMMTARPEPLLDGDWVTNGVGRKGELQRLLGFHILILF